MRLPSTLTLGLGAIVAFATPAMAACTISVTPVNFGKYDVFSASALDSTGTITYSCTTSAPIVIQLDRGSGGSFTPRKMTSGTATLGYNVYLDAARTVIWGDGSSGTQAYADPSPSPNAAINVPVYGRIPARQDVSVGSYSDAITVTIQF